MGTAKGPALGALLLPETGDDLLAGHAADLDAAWRGTADGLIANTDVSVDADGKLHLGKDGTLDDRASLQYLRNRLAGMIGAGGSVRADPGSDVLA